MDADQGAWIMRTSKGRRHLRHQGWLGGGILIGLVVAATWGAGRPARLETIEAAGLVLRNQTGAAYASVTHSEQDGAVLSLNDSAGKPRLRLQVRGDGAPLVRLSDSRGTDSLELALLDDATPRMLLRDGTNTERAKLFLMPDGAPLLYLKDKTGAHRVELASMGSRLDGLIIFDDRQKPRCLLATVPGQDFAGLLMLTAEGEPTMKIGVSTQDKPVVSGMPELPR
jgi:hypothetical protein